VAAFDWRGQRIDRRRSPGWGIDTSAERRGGRDTAGAPRQDTPRDLAARRPTFGDGERGDTTVNPSRLPSLVAPPDSHEYETLALADGSQVRYRPVRPGDVADLRRFYADLSPYSRYMRFFAPVSILISEQIRRVSHLDTPQQFGIIARDPADMMRIVAVVGYTIDPGADSAEIAVTVADAWQGRGVGRALTRHLVGAAQRRGLRSLVAAVLPENVRMFRILTSLGLPMRRTWEQGYLRIEITLAPEQVGTAATMQAAATW
jgi:RimJ/RimL family protein N-acetyltransferase